MGGREGARRISSEPTHARRLKQSTNSQGVIYSDDGYVEIDVTFVAIHHCSWTTLPSASASPVDLQAKNKSRVILINQSVKQRSSTSWSTHHEHEHDVRTAGSTNTLSKTGPTINVVTGHRATSREMALREFAVTAT